MSPRTIFLSSLIGLYCIFISLCVIAYRQATVDSVSAILHNPLMVLALRVLTLAAGLAMVLAHTIWSGGAISVMVALVGWIMLMNSLILLFLPPEVEAEFFLNSPYYQRLFYIYLSILPILGICLTYRGFSLTPHS